MKEKLKSHFIIAGGIGKVIDIREYLINKSTYALAIAHFLDFIRYYLLKLELSLEKVGLIWFKGPI